jgi:hypothetical protein
MNNIIIYRPGEPSWTSTARGPSFEAWNKKAIKMPDYAIAVGARK